MIGFKGVIAAFSMMLLMGCATVKNDWHKAQRQDTVQAYQKFLSEHSDTEFSQEAKRRVVELDWKRATSLRTVQSYQAFLRKHPQSRFSFEAKLVIQRLNQQRAEREEHAANEGAYWQKAQRLDTIEAYRDFMKRYQQSKFIHEADRRITELAERHAEEFYWQKAKRLKTIEAYQDFMRQYPQSEFTQEANRGLTEATERQVTALQDEDVIVRMRAAEALDELGWTPRNDTERVFYFATKDEWDKCAALGTPAVGPLLTFLIDEENYVRRRAARSLDKLGWTPTNPTERVFYLLAKEEWDKCTALGAPAVEPLIEALTHKGELVREKAAYILGLIGDDRAVEPLIITLQDEAWKVRWKSAHALGTFGVARAVEPLIAALDDERDFTGMVQSTAARALAKIGDPRALQPLATKAAETYKDHVRSAAAAAWAQIPSNVPPDVKQQIVRLCSISLPERVAAARALKQMGQRATHAIPFLIATLDDVSNTEVRRSDPIPEPGGIVKTYLETTIQYKTSPDEAACETLVALGPAAVPSLTAAALNHETFLIRYKAAEALVGVGAEAVPSLIAALKPENLPVLTRAVNILVEIQDSKAVEALQDLARSDDRLVRRVATTALAKIRAN